MIKNDLRFETMTGGADLGVARGGRCGNRSRA